MKKTVGILGGMGPQATVDLMAKVIAATPSTEEADHIHMLVDCNPQVPNRTAALLAGAASPGPVLAAMARGLVSGGAEVLAMPCNTAHAFLTDITAAVDVPVLDMIELTAGAALLAGAGHAPAHAIGLLATRGTRSTRLYHERLAHHGFGVVDLDEAGQTRLDGLIHHAKTAAVTQGEREAMAELIASLAAAGATSVIAGCTEVPLLLPENPGLPVIDPTSVLAHAIVAACANGRR